MSKFLPLFEPMGDAAVKGLFSALNPAAIGPGMLYENQNFTWADDGVIKSRLGVTQVFDTGSLGTGHPVGLTKEPIPWGTNVVMLVAWVLESAPSVVRIYYRKYDTATDTIDPSWTEATTNIGQFGDTRGVLPTYGPVNFEAVSDSGGVVGCIVQFGERSENVLLVNFAESFVAVPIKASLAPKWAGASAAEATMSAWMNVNSGTMKSSPAWGTNGSSNIHYNVGGTWDVAGDGELNLSTAGGNGREWRLVGGTGGTYGPAANDYGWFQLNATVDFSGGKQVVMLYDASSSEFYFSHCQIALTQQVETGTTSATTAFKLTQSGQNFTSTVRVGDFVINATDGTQTTVSAVDSDTVLSLVADVVPTGKVYYIVRKYVIHDPAATTPVNEKRDVEVESVTSVKMAVFPVPQEATLSAVDGIMFTVVNTTNWTTAQTLRMQWIACGGQVPGEAQYALAYYSTKSRTDSPSVVLRSAKASENASTLVGVNTNRDPDFEYFVSVRTGVAGGSVPSGFYMPISKDVYYKYRVPIFAPISATVNDVTAPSGWADRMSIYRKDPGEAQYTHVSDTTISSYSGSWIINSSIFLDKNGTGVTDLSLYQKMKAYVTDSTEIGDKDFKRKAPDAFNEPVPVGQAMMFSGKRLHVGAYNSSNSANADQMNELRVSEVNRPFRFRTLPREINQVEDVDSGFAIPLGNESIRSLFDVSASVIGSPATYCVTDKSLIRYIGYEPRRIAGSGCIAPGSVNEKDGVTFWVDHENQVRTMEGVLSEVSKGIVDDSLDTCPATRRQFMEGVSHRDRYYLSLADGSSNNNYRVLVWSLKRKAWEAYHKYPTTKAPQYWLLWNVDGNSKVYFMAYDGTIYELNSGADDAGTTIDLALTFGNIYDSSDRTKSVKLERFGAVADDATSQTLTVTYTDLLNTSSTATSTISLDGSVQRVKKTGLTSSSLIPGLECDCAKVRLTGTKTSATGRMVFHWLGIEVDSTGVNDFGV